MNLLLADININWYLPPLILAISLVYSATRFESWRLIWIYSIRWAVYILTFLGGTYAFLYFVSLDVGFYWYVAACGILLILYFRPLRGKRADPASSRPSS